ncbi:hypothetical protein MTR_1g019910 [Medicago truncatula]|uniref:Uncharacterized protein n=1 Tax=Medicago truncatula TaxID=3880 RepID=G7I4G7_MEDTR|nr:hypothetical protein MTR_1g019910 [Medicago truncatula]
MDSHRHEPYSPVEFSITEASIIRFSLTSNETLYYNFKVNITSRNFNDEISYYISKCRCNFFI